MDEEKLIRNQDKQSDLDQRWWLRLARVTYIALHIPLLIIALFVWEINAPSCNIYGTRCSGSYEEVFWYLTLSFAIYITIMRLIKISFLYISLSQKPQWKDEFKKLF